MILADILSFFSREELGPRTVCAIRTSSTIANGKATSSTTAKKCKIIVIFPFA